ncbi:hypothetical protein K9B35_10980 [Sphingomonas sp. R647]|uniref:hypothetical protein n=1 Tax=Sphingomonas sp. R647 TaxID=2875233 RepID=UPI001CD73C09|nr:hypothetical protein [Sphingomonas sp. R647]MCA1198494.1 hypothetical protein [Sphingomonas sp. R647]
MDRAAFAFIEPMIGLPVWGANQGFGSFLTLEFGAPSPVREGYGEWHVWIYCCNWQILREGVELAWSESDSSSIKRAVSTLNQHCLSDISVEPPSGRSAFLFDGGLALETWPYGGDPSEEQWMIYAGSRVLTHLADGGFRDLPSTATMHGHG